MKVTVPESIADITLGQYQNYTKILDRDDLNEVEFARRKMSIFLNIPYRDTDKIDITDFKALSDDIDKALNNTAKFVNRFEMNGVEFGFIPNFDKMTTKEFVDLSLYPANEIETYHNLMAILFRPIKNKDAFNNYSLVSYQGSSDYAEIMKGMPMHIVDGALVFFCNLSKDLQKSTQRYMEEELRKAVVL